MKLTPADVEALERSTLAALSPRILDEDDDWLIALDDGAIGRANSVTPLRLGMLPIEEKVGRAQARYLAEGLTPQFRLPEAPVFDPLRQALAARGYAPGKPTSVQVVATRIALERLRVHPGQVDAAPDPAWLSVFTDQGFDQADGASRARIWSHDQDAAFASVRQGNEALAIGVASFSHGWAGIHGMRTRLAHRGRGLGRSVLAGLTQAAWSRGMDRLFLQVEQDNPPAWALYRAAGFEPAWTYWYWRPKASGSSGKFG